MVRVVHEHGGARAEGEATGCGAGMFLLTNKKGSFFSLCPGVNITKYNGFVHYDAPSRSFWKSVESLSLPGTVTTVRNRLSVVEREYASGAVERFRLSSKAVHYELDGHHGELFLDLDVRRLDDESADGRFYRVTREPGRLIIRYEKRGAYIQHLVIEGVTDFRRIGEWQERRYAYDERRGDSSVFWVYRAGAITVDGSLRLIIVRSESEEKARAKASSVHEHAESIVQSIDAYARNAYRERRLEQNLALAALDSLVTRLKGNGFGGILAGLPWFTQFWSRDELISLGALIEAEQYGLVKEVLIRYYELLDEGGLRALYPDQGLRAADAIGWLAKRTYDLLLALDERGLLKGYFTRIELAYLRDRMADALPDVLVVNGPGETWMDAAFDGDTRAGTRVEIQALHLCRYRLLEFIEGKTRRIRLLQTWRRREQELLRRVRASLFRRGELLDGVVDGTPDPTVRPNCFLAHYLCPWLLAPDEWRAVFDRALQRLSLPWGGLATIDTADQRFVPRYSGRDDRSYHRGDSWYWVNALAAISLRRLDERRYAETIGRLRDGCLRDLLFQGAVGHCSELSSAAEQEWGGTFAQAWSAALLFELLRQ